MRRIRIAAASLMVAAGLIGAVAAPALCGEAGESGLRWRGLSALATNQPSNGSFGAGASGLAQDPSGRPGLGDFAQAALAGLIPDEVLPNTCND